MGYGRYGPSYTATLTIGCVAGLDYGQWRQGMKIPPFLVHETVMTRRAAQVGENGSGATILPASGYYRGFPIESVCVRLVWLSSPKEPTGGHFLGHIKRLAQGVASVLAQSEILVEWQTPDGSWTDAASPLQAPPPTDRKRFIAWTRRFGAKMGGSQVYSKYMQRGPSCNLDDCGDPVPPRVTDNPPESVQTVLDREGYEQQGPSCGLDDHGDPVPPRVVKRGGRR